MMRFLCFFACVAEGYRAAERAMGLSPQLIYGPDFVWVWWLSALGFICAGFLVLFNGVE